MQAGAAIRESHDRGARFAALLGEWRADPGTGRMPILMGIINTTPDSFSDGGVNFDGDTAAANGRRLFEEGAKILDIGGESTRPGGERVPAEEEKRRVLPVISALAGGEAILSVDTVKAEVAEAALQAGAEIVNDVQGLKGEPALAEATASAGAGLVIMHNPALFGSRTGTEGDPVSACLAFFERSLQIARRAGVKEDRIALDPGFGFGKSVEQNLALLARLSELAVLGFPLLVGTSRKTFIGRVTGREVDRRLFGTLATGLAAAERGAAILRVHDVAAHADALRMISAIENEAGPWRER